MSEATRIIPAQVTLNSLRDGQVMNELAQAIHDATKGVRDLNQAAKVTLTLDLMPIKGIDQGLREPPINVVAEVIVKLPKPPLPSTLFYVDENGNPTRTPTARQPDLGLTIAKGGTAS